MTPQIFSVVLMICAGDPCNRDTYRQKVETSFEHRSGSRTPCVDFLRYQLAHMWASEDGPMRVQYECAEKEDANG